MSTQWHIVCICGSMRYYKLMLEVAERETANGHIVLMPFVQKGADRPGGDSQDFKDMLDDMHREKIRMSHEIIKVGSYTGESTKGELEYAVEIGLAIRTIAYP